MRVPMLTQTIHDARAWRAATLPDPAAWYYLLPEPCRAALDQSIVALRSAPRPLVEINVADYPCGAHAADLAPIRNQLAKGPGFAIITGLPLDRYAADEAQALYWMLGQLIGRPMPQNVQGTRLYDVRDTGQDVQYGARFSVTNAESSFHTDNSFGDDLTDYVGLLCLRAAKSGGVSQVVSGYAAHNELLQNHRDVLETLYQPVHVDRRGGMKAGEPPTAQFPIFQWTGRDLICRYLRYWIEAGQQKVSQPLTPAQVNALDSLDAVLRRPELRIEFTLRPGEIFFLNNRWLFHNRSAFEDQEEPARRRHYVRLWLRAGA